jgi:hypothetical protein
MALAESDAPRVEPCRAKLPGGAAARGVRGGGQMTEANGCPRGGELLPYPCLLVHLSLHVVSPYVISHYSRECPINTWWMAMFQTWFFMN